MTISLSYFGPEYFLLGKTSFLIPADGFFFFMISLLWWCWVFVAVYELSGCAERGCPAGRGLAIVEPLLMQSTALGSWAAVVAAARRIFLGQGSNPCPLHWQAGFCPVYHQGSPWLLHKYYQQWGGSGCRKFCPVSCELEFSKTLPSVCTVLFS